MPTKTTPQTASAHPAPNGEHHPFPCPCPAHREDIAPTSGKAPAKKPPEWDDATVGACDSFA